MNNETETLASEELMPKLGSPSDPAELEPDAERKGGTENSDVENPNSPSDSGDNGDTSSSTDKQPNSEAKTSTRNWPLRDVKEPCDNDVLYGRGGGTNHHVGNKKYRKMVEERKVDYVNSKRLDKPLVALEIIRQWRAQDPPGRFLKLNERTGLWHDVGDKKAREKTSQALREKAPLLRQQQKEEKEGKDSPGRGESVGVPKTARFDIPEGEERRGEPGKSVKRAILARDHSLGRDYIEPNQAVTLDGFSWGDPVQEIYGKGKREPAVEPRNERQTAYSSSRTDPGWGAAAGAFADSSGAPPTQMPPLSNAPIPTPYGHHRNNSQTSKGSHIDPPPNRETIEREHSLRTNPLREASTSGPAQNPFSGESRTDSTDGLDMSWCEGVPGTGLNDQSQFGFPAPKNRRFVGNGSSAFSRAASGEHGSLPVSAPQTSSRASSGHSVSGDRTKYSVPESVARTWSNQSDDFRKVASMMGDDPFILDRTYSGQSDMSQERAYSRDGDDPRYRPPGSSPFATAPPTDGASYASRVPSASRRGYNYGSEPGTNTFCGEDQSARSSADNDYFTRQRHEEGAFHPGTTQTATRGEFSSNSETPPRGTARPKPPVAKPSLRRKISGGGVTPQSAPPLAQSRNLARPNPVKRDTSHQNENIETKPRDHKRSIMSRAVLNRDHSLAQHTLTGPNVSGGLTASIFDDAESDAMTTLENSMEQSTLEGKDLSPRKPSALTSKDRLSTDDALKKWAFGGSVTAPGTSDRSSFRKGGMDGAKRPPAMTSSERLSTADVDSLLMSVEKEIGVSSNPTAPLPERPNPLSSSQRMSTMDALNSIVSEGLPETNSGLGIGERATNEWLSNMDRHVPDL